ASMPRCSADTRSAQRAGDLRGGMGCALSLRAPPGPAPDRREADGEDGGEDDEQDARMRDVGLDVPALYLVRNQDEGAEDRAGGNAATRPRLRADMLE